MRAARHLPDNAPEDLDLEYGAMPLHLRGLKIVQPLSPHTKAGGPRLSLLMEALDLKLRSGTGPGAAGRLAIEAMQFEKLGL